MNWYLEALKKYAVFSGRARRKGYWYFVLLNTIIILVLATIDSMRGGTYSSEAGMGLVGGIFALAVFISALAVSVRRLHDTDRSGWWLLASLIPIIGSIALLVFMVQDGESGNNRYGLDPKQGGVIAA